MTETPQTNYPYNNTVKFRIFWQFGRFIFVAKTSHRLWSYKNVEILKLERDLGSYKLVFFLQTALYYIFWKTLRNQGKLERPKNSIVFCQIFWPTMSKISFCKGYLTLYCRPMQFWDFANISLLPKILWGIYNITLFFKS